MLSFLNLQTESSTIGPNLPVYEWKHCTQHDLQTLCYMTGLNTTDTQSYRWGRSEKTDGKCVDGCVRLWKSAPAWSLQGVTLSALPALTYVNTSERVLTNAVDSFASDDIGSLCDVPVSWLININTNAVLISKHSFHIKTLWLMIKSGI